MFFCGGIPVTLVYREHPPPRRTLPKKHSKFGTSELEEEEEVLSTMEVSVEEARDVEPSRVKRYLATLRENPG